MSKALSPSKVAFLSRLCGGEYDEWLEWTNEDFLSRLCGGEFVEHDCDYIATFLSRLCGGESSR